MDDGASAYDKAFLLRTKELRKKWGGSQADMAEALGISVDIYEKNETRTLLPHRLVPRFAHIVGADIAFMFTGRHIRSGRPSASTPQPIQKGGVNRSISAKKPRASSG